MQRLFCDVQQPPLKPSRVTTGTVSVCHVLSFNSPNLEPIVECIIETGQLVINRISKQLIDFLDKVCPGCKRSLNVVILFLSKRSIADVGESGLGLGHDDWWGVGTGEFGIFDWDSGFVPALVGSWH
jgi:hypothetical protein